MIKMIQIVCSLVIAAITQAQIIHVPGDYPTIQQGINAAAPGDTVLVADGIYFEQINFLGKKPLTVASEYLLDGDTSHIAKTIIDGSRLTDLNNASVVYFISGEDTTSILYGFTIRHGKGTLNTQQGFVLRDGGGIYISGAGAGIFRNRITENHLTDELPGNPEGVYGAGISVFGTLNDWVIIDHNIICQNSCTSGGLQAAGGGALIYRQHFRITHNIISGNTCTGVGNTSSVGAGFVCYCLEECQVNGIVQHNVISNNLSQAENNYASSGGGFFQFISGLFSENLVENNQVITWSESGGTGGFYSLAPGEGAVIRNNIFKNNNSTLWAGALCVERYDPGNVFPVLIENNYFLNNQAKKGGAFTDFGIPAILQNNVFSGNQAAQYGGAIYLRKGLTVNVVHLATIINSSFYGNKAYGNGGAVYSDHGFPMIFNSIFFKDSASGNEQEIYLYHASDTVEIADSDIDPGLVSGNIIDGGYNITEDPLFMDTVNLIPYNYSPVIDAGASGNTCNHGIYSGSPPYQINGFARPVGGGYDMGAYDHEAWVMGTQRITNYACLPVRQGLRITNWPNPFNNYTTFEYTINEHGQVRLQVYNSLWQLVYEKINNFQEAGKHELIWDAGNLPSGLYFYRILKGRDLGSGKMMKF